MKNYPLIILILSLQIYPTALPFSSPSQITIVYSLLSAVSMCSSVIKFPSTASRFRDLSLPDASCGIYSAVSNAASAFYSEGKAFTPHLRLPTSPPAPAEVSDSCFLPERS